MSEYDVKVTHLYGDKYRVEVYPSARPVIFGLAALLGIGLIVHLMDKYGLTFEQAIWTITGAIVALMAAGAGFVVWLKPKLDRFFDGY